MWNPVFNCREDQNGYEDNYAFNSYQQGNSYSDFYSQQYQPEYPYFYQQPCYQEQYFNQQQQPLANYPPYQQTELQNPYQYPPQNQSNIETMLLQLRDMMIANTAQLSEMTARYETMGTQVAQPSDSSSTCQIQETVEETTSESVTYYTGSTWSRLLVDPDIKVPHYSLVEDDIDEDIDGEVTDEDTVEIEDSTDEKIEAIENSENLSENRPVLGQTDRFSIEKLDSIKIDHQNRSVFNPNRPVSPEESKNADFSTSKANSKESKEHFEVQPIVQSPLEDATCLDSCEHGNDSYDELFALMEDAIFGEGLTQEQNERLAELVHDNDTPVPEINEPEPPTVDNMHHERSSSSVTWDSLEFKQTLTKNLVWGSSKNFELTGEGEYGEYSRYVVDESKTDPAAKGHIFRWSHNGLRDHICYSYCRSSARSCNFLDYDDPGDEQRPSTR